MNRLIIIILALASVLAAQEGTTVNQIIGPPPSGYTVLRTFSGSNVTHVCTAKSIQSAYTASVAGKTMTNIVVLTNVGTVTWTGHGLAVGNSVTVAGTTVDTDLNTTYIIQTTPTADTFTITTANVDDATYTTGLTITTTAPRSTAAIWSIQRDTYSGSNPVLSQWANGDPSLKAICANVAALAYQ